MDLINAIINNDVIHVMRILQRGIDPNEYVVDANLTPLHFAVQNNAVDVVMLLITAGADPFLPNEEGVNPFDIATQYNYVEMIELLLKLAHLKNDYRNCYCE